MGELAEARQAKRPTWAKPGMRQDTPNLDDGILTNCNVLLEVTLANPGPNPNPKPYNPNPSPNSNPCPNANPNPNPNPNPTTLQP